jgi:putative chitinase
MDLATAIRSVAPDAPHNAIDGLISVKGQIELHDALDTPLRAAHMIGQCAHESAGFARLVESLYYSTGARIFAVFGRRHFASIPHAGQFARNQRMLANRVYANRMGNADAASGDGFRFRGRGYLQLTGRGNYRSFGTRIGIDLEAEPERAADPATAWLIAASYLASRSRSNGGLNGLEDRRHLTAKALAALGGIEARHPALTKGAEGPPVLRLQHLLTQRGFPVGALDGDFGPKTAKAIKGFQIHSGLLTTSRADAATWRALELGFA